MTSSGAPSRARRRRPRAGGPAPGEQTRARFRPEIKALDRVGEWGWQSNPFRAAAEHRGLIVMMILLNNSDLKPAQNVAERYVRRFKQKVAEGLALR